MKFIKGQYTKYWYLVGVRHCNAMLTIEYSYNGTKPIGWIERGTL